MKSLIAPSRISEALVAATVPEILTKEKLIINKSNCEQDNCYLSGSQRNQEMTIHGHFLK